MKKKQLIRGLAIGAATIGLIGGAFAYFSARADQVQNTFDVATGEKDQEDGLEIVEEDWGNTKPNSAGVFEAGMFLQKDPYVQSKVNYDGFTIIKVTVPKAMSVLEGDVDEQGNPVEKMNEVVKIAMDETHPGFNEDDFVKLATIDSDDSVAYYYGYKAVLKSGEKTSDLFQGIIINKFDKLRDPADTEENVATKIKFDVDVDARLVQEIDTATGVAYTSVQDAFTKAYVNTIDGDGKVTAVKF